MVPPFLAYYGVITKNRTIVDQAYDQIKLYRDQLYDSDASAWRHIVGGSSGADPSFWATGEKARFLRLGVVSNLLQVTHGLQRGCSESTPRSKRANSAAP